MFRIKWFTSSLVLWSLVDTTQAVHFMKVILACLGQSLNLHEHTTMFA